MNVTYEQLQAMWAKPMRDWTLYEKRVHSICSAGSPSRRALEVLEELRSACAGLTMARHCLRDLRHNPGPAILKMYHDDIDDCVRSVTELRAALNDTYPTLLEGF